MLPIGVTRQANGFPAGKEFECMHKTFTDHWLINGLSSDAAQSLFMIGDVIAVSADDVLIEADIPNDAMYFILEGAFKIYLPQRPARRRGGTLAHRGPGDLIGEYSFVDRFSPAARVIASMRGVVLRIRHEAMADFLGGDPVVGSMVYRNMLAYLVDRLRAQDEEIESLMF